MGTRSLTHVVDERGTTLVTIYRQFDGYPSGHGDELAGFLADRVVVNGFGSGTPAKASNGMGCLAASLVDELKDGIGGVYLVPPGSDDHGEEYTYTVKLADDGLWLVVDAYGQVVFDDYIPKWDADAVEGKVR